MGGQARPLWQVQLGGTSSLRSVFELECAFERGDIDERTPVRKPDEARWTTYGAATGRTFGAQSPWARDDEPDSLPPVLSAGSLSLTREEIDSARPRSLKPIFLLGATAALVGGGVFADRHVPGTRSFFARVPAIVSHGVRVAVDAVPIGPRVEPLTNRTAPAPGPTSATDAGAAQAASTPSPATSHARAPTMTTVPRAAPTAPPARPPPAVTNVAHKTTSTPTTGAKRTMTITTPAPTASSSLRNAQPRPK
jgi:hypothetical protein